MGWSDIPILRIRTPNAITSYPGDPGATGGVSKNGWFYNGDIGSVSQDSLLTIGGRSGDFINSGGNKVSSRVIEDVLLSMPDVTEAAFGVLDRMGVMQICRAHCVPATRSLATGHRNFTRRHERPPVSRIRHLSSQRRNGPNVCIRATAEQSGMTATDAKQRQQADVRRGNC